MLRVLVIGAVLGPTHLGDTYQVTNTLPNLLWYGFLAGSLVPALLVPVLVRHVAAGSPDRVAAISRGFLGVVVLAAAVLGPLAVVGLPLLLHLSTSGTAHTQQLEMARVLVALTVPQTFLYAVIGTSAAVMYTHDRFALPSIGPTVENLGVISVLLVTALGYGQVASGAHVAWGELVLLGGGSTIAVALNASLQWWGARRCGVSLFPTRGWRDEAVRTVLSRARGALGTAALLASQTLLILLLASRVTGGAVALQVALNFYILPIALIATPVGLGLLPELSRLEHAGRSDAFADTFASAVASALFLAAPASAAYVLLAGPIADVVAVGQMNTPTAHAMISGSLAALAIGQLGQTAAFLCTQTFYARGDTRTPMLCMAGQALCCALFCGVAVVLSHGTALLPAVASAYAGATVLGGTAQLLLVVRPTRLLLARLGPALARVLLGIVVMAGPVRLALVGLRGVAPGREGSLVALVGASLVGLAVFGGVQRLLRAPELGWWASGLRSRVSEPAS